CPRWRPHTRSTMEKSGSRGVVLRGARTCRYERGRRKAPPSRPRRTKDVCGEREAARHFEQQELSLLRTGRLIRQYILSAWLPRLCALGLTRLRRRNPPRWFGGLRNAVPP